MSNQLTVGPIVGYTTNKSVRLWGRGDLHYVDPKNKSKGVKRCYGIVQVLDSTNNVIASKSFPMYPHFDFTGVVDFDELRANTKYNYKMGYLVDTLEGDLPQPNPNDFNGLPTYQFTAAVDNDNSQEANNISFVFGSCRYLLRLFGGSFFDGRGDKTFRSILGQINNERKRTDFLLMLGDQIYADDLNFIFPDNSASEFHKRYTDAFSQEHIRKLMSQLPTYMMMDDHEIEDNWSMDDYLRKQKLYNIAMSAYHSYQLVHSPAFTPATSTNISATPTKRYYSFNVGSTKLFIMDTRTERFKNANPPQIVSREQMKALKAWLLEDRRALKFIGTSVPFFPDHKTESKDKWSGFEAQRNEILEFIRANGIRKVVFLSGDVHLSAWATLTCSSDPSFRVHSIISSAFYWPYPAESKFAFKSDGILTTVGQNQYSVVNSGGYRNEDNFTRVTSEDNQRLLVEIYDRKGAKLDATFLPL